MTLETRIDNGSSDNRVDIVFMGDGYRASEFNLFEQHADNLTDYLFQTGGQLSDPFERYANFFNVHLIYTESNESGADDPATNQFVDTAFDSTYLFDGVTDRLLSVDNAKTTAVMDAELAGTDIEPDMRFVTVNSAKYGGAGGYFATYSGGNTSALELALHEVAHSFTGLADEYGGFNAPFPGGEPTETNVTVDVDGDKWAHWLGYNQPDIGVIGTYEGGRYYDSGIYRPSDNSKMRNLGQPFDVVSIEQFILKFYEFVDPLDSWSHSDVTLVTGVKKLSVTPIDVEVIDIEWSLDGEMLGFGDVTKLNLTKLGLAPGTLATISARAYDPTDMVRIRLDELEMTVNWDVEIPDYVNLIRGDSGKNKLIGVAWDDKIVGKGGNDRLVGKNGDDKLLGGGGKDKLFGGNGKDILLGGGKSDLLDGGAKNDRLTGGAGADVFAFAKNIKSGKDTITDFQDGIDTIKFSGGLNFDDLAIEMVGANTVVSWTKGKVVLKDIDASLIDADDFNFV